MIKISLLFAVTVLLAGCAADDDNNDNLTGRFMMQQSEECREHAAQLQSASGLALGRPVDAKTKDFDRDYHACMSTKGYAFGGN